MDNRHFSKMSDSELAGLVIDANKVQEMVNTAGYREVVAPKLIEAKGKAEAAARWRPGMTIDAEAVALTGIYKDGRISGLEEMAEIISDAMADKDEAMREIHRRKEKGQ